MYTHQIFKYFAYAYIFMCNICLRECVRERACIPDWSYNLYLRIGRLLKEGFRERLLSYYFHSVIASAFMTRVKWREVIGRMCPAWVMGKNWEVQTNSFKKFRKRTWKIMLELSWLGRLVTMGELNSNIYNILIVPGEAEVSVVQIC